MGWKADTATAIASVIGRGTRTWVRETTRAILALLDKPPPQGYAPGRVRCWPRHWETLMFSILPLPARAQRRPCRPQIVVREQRPCICGESRRCSRALCRSPRQGDCSLRRRKAFIFQALERAQGYLKLPNGRALTGQSHDYKLHGTTTLFAALEVATWRRIRSGVAASCFWAS